jgi:hypothetical protein
MRKIENLQDFKLLLSSVPACQIGVSLVGVQTIVGIAI